MGKRKKASKPQTAKKRQTLDTQFQCLFCNHEKSINVKLYKKEGIGQLDCRICGQSYQTGINYLSAAVDVYTDWIDACEAVAEKDHTDPAAGAAAISRRQPASRNMAPRIEDGGGEEDDLDGFIENDELDQEAAYTGTMA